MKRRVLGSYLRWRIIGQTLALLAVLTGIMQLLELLDVMTDVLDRELGVPGVLRYALLRLPSEMLVGLPLAVLLGGMAAFYAMARTREITAMRSSGVSIRRIMLWLLPVPLLFGILQMALSQTIAPWAESHLKVWWDASAPEEGAPPRWVHTSAGPVSFERSSADGRVLEGLRIYSRDDDGGLLTTRTIAEAAVWSGDQWLLDSVQDLNINTGLSARVREAQRPWRANLRPEDIIQLDVAQPRLSSIMLADVIAGERVSGQPLSYYQTVLLRSFTAPLGLFIMLLLAVSPALTMERGGGGGRLLIALALGLGFLLCDGIMAALGTGGRVPPLVAVLVAPVTFATIGLVQLFSCERVSPRNCA